MRLPRGRLASSTGEDPAADDPRLWPRSHAGNQHAPTRVTRTAGRAEPTGSRARLTQATRRRLPRGRGKEGKGGEVDPSRGRPSTGYLVCI